MNILEFSGSNPRISLLARSTSTGPEAELVRAFKPYIPACFRWQRGDVAIFNEPKIETGFPDLVAAQYSPESFAEWSQARLKLIPIDLKVIHHLLQVKGADSETLLPTLGIGARVLLASLERLLDANMITRFKGKWQPRSRKAVFGIRSIMAVEAKMKNWLDAFHQGQLNQWFASESYVLSPVEKPQASVLDRSRKTGVGILLLNGTRVRCLRKAEKVKIPASYGSWLFNEWIGRRLHES